MGNHMAAVLGSQTSWSHRPRDGTQPAAVTCPRGQRSHQADEPRRHGSGTVLAAVEQEAMNLDSIRLFQLKAPRPREVSSARRMATGRPRWLIRRSLGPTMDACWAGVTRGQDRRERDRGEGAALAHRAVGADEGRPPALRDDAGPAPPAQRRTVENARDEPRLSFGPARIPGVRRGRLREREALRTRCALRCWC